MNNDMSLVDSLAECLSNSVVLKNKAQGYHWNVMGPDFGEFHDFFGSYYEDVESAIDHIAEAIRYRGVQAPYKLSQFMALSSLSESEVGSDAMGMLEDLLFDNKRMISCMSSTFDAAVAANDQGIADFIAGRLGAHEKWNWKISAYLGQEATLDTAPARNQLGL
jgi:starvation-inducible DNA-binding protein